LADRSISGTCASESSGGQRWRRRRPA